MPMYDKWKNVGTLQHISIGRELNIYLIFNKRNVFHKCYLKSIDSEMKFFTENFLSPFLSSNEKNAIYR